MVFLDTLVLCEGIFIEKYCGLGVGKLGAIGGRDHNSVRIRP